MTPAERRNYVGRVRAKLQHRPRCVEYSHISERTGLTVAWLKSFSRGQFEKPSIVMVKQLESFFADVECDA